MTAPAAVVEELPYGGIYLQLTKRLPVVRKELDELDRVRAAVKEHLDCDVFFDRVKGREHKYRVPDFALPERN